MTSTKKPNGQEDIKFVMTGTDESITQFTPASSNSAACGGGNCTVGKKPIVVAGGKLFIEALPPNTPTWLPLHDVVTESSARSLQQNVGGCANTGAYISEDFTTAPSIASAFLPSRGTKISLEDSRLLMYDRTSSLHQLYIDLKDIRHCLEPDRLYMLNSRVKFARSDGAELTEVRESFESLRCLWLLQLFTSYVFRFHYCSVLSLEMDAFEFDMNGYEKVQRQQEGERLRKSARATVSRRESGLTYRWRYTSQMMISSRPMSTRSYALMVQELVSTLNSNSLSCAYRPT